MAYVCEHGRLRRSCSECDDKETINETINQLRALNAELLDSLECLLEEALKHSLREEDAVAEDAHVALAKARGEK